MFTFALGTPCAIYYYLANQFRPHTAVRVIIRSGYKNMN